MKRIKKVFVAVHSVLWFLFTFLVAMQLFDDNEHWVTITAGVIATCLYVFYNHFNLLTRYSGRKKNVAYFLRIAGITLTGPIPYLVFNYRKLENGEAAFESYMMILVSFVIIFLFLGWLARVTENLVINTVKKEQLEKQAVEAELYYLKSQINPHFLFNTLNNIHTLVYKQAPTAPEAVMQLASLMRYMSYESNAPTVPLKRELEYLQDYMSLQQLRYKQNPVDMKIEGNTEACHIAPLLFIHLLENAYKHSHAQLNPGDIKVSVLVKNSVLSFSVQNRIGKKIANTLGEQGGIGLSNVRKRLALLYPEQHLMEIHDTGDLFTVVLKIQGLQIQPDERKAHLFYH
ncbi:sensor histidine kinase [Pollutibacter soli]|uniref:sensor histidine kinase n=1 Tax=Pollutibacter soli TaxID=3034157 RepID=UPI003013705E